MIFLAVDQRTSNAMSSLMEAFLTSEVRGVLGKELGIPKENMEYGQERIPLADSDDEAGQLSIIYIAPSNMSPEEVAHFQRVISQTVIDCQHLREFGPLVKITPQFRVGIFLPSEVVNLFFMLASIPYIITTVPTGNWVTYDFLAPPAT